MSFLQVLFLLIALLMNAILITDGLPFPLVANTWAWTQATDAAFETLLKTGSSISAIVSGCTKCEQLQCNGSVGYGGSPDTTGETTLDAMLMYGPTHDVGGVGDLRRIKNAIGVARAVLEHTQHTLIAGESATNFAIMMGFEQTNLTTNKSLGEYEEWTQAQCQPNYFINCYNETSQCPPYIPVAVNDPKFIHPLAKNELRRPKVDENNHDTIGMIAIEPDGNMSVGTSTNGLDHKVAGRVGDSPIAGAGAYVIQGVGGAVATGDGDIMMRFLPTHSAVLHMKNGMSPSDACTEPLKEIAKFYPNYQGALLCVTANGTHGGGSYGWTFQYSIRNIEMNETQVVVVEPFTL